MFLYFQKKNTYFDNESDEEEHAAGERSGQVSKPKGGKEKVQMHEDTCACVYS